MIVLLSSAARPRYADDIVRALALPAGAQMHFRYNRSWVEPELFQRIPREQLAGEPILVCFLAGNGADRPYTIIPIRYARLIRAERIGSSCVFIFDAGSFVTELNDAGVRAAVNASIRSLLPNPAPGSGALFAFEAALAAPHPEQSANIAAFERTVARVAEHPPFTSEDTAFFTVFRVSEIRGRSWFGTWPQPERLQMGAYRLAGGKRYECEVYCLRPNDASTGTAQSQLGLEVTSDDEPLTFASATRGEIDSRYDVKRFVFFSEPTVLSRVSGFRVFIVSGTDDDAQRGRDVSLQVVLGGTLLLGPLRALLIGAGTAGPAMVAANAAGKLNNIETVLLMLLLGMLAGVATIFPNLRKP